MENIEGRARLIVEAALFVFALLQGIAALFQILDRHQIIQKAKREQGVTPPSRFPIFSVILAIGALLAILFLFWMVYDPPVKQPVGIDAQKQSAPVGSVLSKQSEPLFPAIQPQPARRDREAQSQVLSKPLKATSASAPASSAIEADSKPKYQQQCVASACAQGPGSQATFNQFGPPKLIITSAQEFAIASAMKPYAGLSFSITLVNETQSTHSFADSLCRALTSAGMVSICGKYSYFIPVSSSDMPGINAISDPSNYPAIEALANTLGSSGVFLAGQKMAVGENSDKSGIAFRIKPYE